MGKAVTGEHTRGAVAAVRGDLEGALPSLQLPHPRWRKSRPFPMEDPAAPAHESLAAGPGESPHPQSRHLPISSDARASQKSDRTVPASPL